MAEEHELVSGVFHTGPVLAAAQAAGIWADSKTFVDCPARVPLSQVLADFRAAFGDTAVLQSSSDRAAVTAFVFDHFHTQPGDELQAHTPADWAPNVEWLQTLTPADAVGLGTSLHALWGVLCRVSTPSPHSTLLPLPYPCFVPGDRFRETYYWDSLFIVRGLLAVGMTASAVGVARNLLHLVRVHGCVPNGARSYYTNRSQPPVLGAILAALDDAFALDAHLCAEAVPLLVQEWRFWTSGSHDVAVAVTGDQPAAVHRLSRYFASWCGPRPESWREDVHTAQHVTGRDSAARKARLWRELATAAESGWDFSSRWCTRCTRVVPADLNAFLLVLARGIARWAARLGDAATAGEFQAHADARAAAMHAVLWNAEAAQWRDFELEGFNTCAADTPGESEQDVAPVWSGQQSTRVFASNWVPLWCGALQPGSAEAAACCVSLRASGLLQPGGIATSTLSTGQQWDWPNAWPPLQLLLAEGVDMHCGAPGKELSDAIAGTYLRACAAGLDHGGVMHEKYDATVAPGGGGPNAGGGGEYAPQVGFGWSNGVALAMLRRHGGIPDSTLANVLACRVSE
jgi:alpha,alpha-trehalase